jgi:hypothetical protein
MKSHYLIHSLFFLSSTLILSGCGGKHSTASSSSLYSTNAQMSAIQDISTEERAIATRICYAYQSKNTNFRTSPYLGSIFTFKVASSTCDSQSLNYSVPSVLTSDSSGLYFKASATTAFQGSIQTNENGYLSQVCSKIQANLAISNTTAISNTKIQVNFFKDTKDNMDSYTLRYFSMSTSKIQSAETFQVRTQFNITSSQILGMDEKYIKQETCVTDSSKYSEITQNYSSITVQ